MATMIKQCKGKDAEKVPKSKLLSDDTEVLVSTKYDGHYVQLHFINGKLTIFTSGNKQIKLPELETVFCHHYSKLDFIVEAEFIGTSEGRLGDRTKCGILTTWRTNTSKGLEHLNLIGDNEFRVHDCLYINSCYVNMEVIKDTALERYTHLDTYMDNFRAISNVNIVMKEQLTFKEAKFMLQPQLNFGWEGLMVQDELSIYQPSKRINEVIKLKGYKTVILTCISALAGEGKYENSLGSLILTNKKGISVSVGSGLSDSQRELPFSYWIGKKIEVKYESFKDTYIQPIFKGIVNETK